MRELLLFLPIVLFLFLLLLTSIWLENRKTAEKTLEDFYLSDRNLEGFVLAMSMIATYGSVSSFVSGPGVAWQLGLGWVVFAAPQIIAGFLVFGVIGKKFAIVGHRIGAVTVIDLIRARFADPWLARLLALTLLVAFVTMMTGQLIGGARLFAAAAGLPYEAGLVLFGLVTVFYTTLGGYRAVVITDTICALLMVGGMFLLGWEIVHLGGGDLEALLLTIPRIDASLTTPNAGGALPWGLLLSAWLLVGFGTVALPHSSMRCLTYRQSDELQRAMLIGTVVCGLLMIGMTFLGVLARSVLDLPVELIGETTDSVIPYLIANHMSPFWAGLTLVGPLAATLSTVSSLMLNASSALVQDLLRKEGLVPDRPKLLFRLSWVVTFVLGLTALLFALYPADIVVWINLIAFGGLETAFLFPLVASLFWRRATGRGALVAAAGGLAAYLWASFANFHPFGAHVVTVGVLVSGVLFVVGSLTTQPEPEERLALFFRPTSRDGSTD